MNNNQYSSLPHTQNTGGVGTQHQRNAYENNNGNPQPNRPYNNKKKHYNKHKNNTYNKPNQPFNTYNTNNNVNHTGKPGENKIPFLFSSLLLRLTFV